MIRDLIRDPVRDPIHDPIHDPIRDPVRDLDPVRSKFCRRQSSNALHTHVSNLWETICMLQS